MAWNADSPFPSSAGLGETDSGARNLPAFLCGLLGPGPVLVLGASEVALLAARDRDVVVLDWNRRRLTRLADCARERGIRLDCVCRDPDREDLGVNPRTLANVICLDVLERSANDVVLLDRIRRALAPEGRLIVRVRAGSPVREETGRDPRPARTYSPVSLHGALVEAGFRATRLRHWNLLGYPVAFFWDRCLGRPHRDDGGVPASERRRHWWDSAADAWFRTVENRCAFPFGVSLVAVATPRLERVVDHAVAPARALPRRALPKTCEPMARSR